MASPAAKPQRGRIRIHVLALILFLLLAVVLTYPLISQITTHVPGDGRDDPPLVWNLWWVPHALISLHSNPLVSTTMFYPIGINLTFFTLTILNAMLSVPLQSAIGLVFSSNINLLASYTLAGFGMYLLALDVLQPSRRSPARSDAVPYVAAFIAGLVYAFAPIKMIFASLGQFNMATTQWLPFCILYILRATRPMLPPASTTQAQQSSIRRLLLTFFPLADRPGRHDALKAAIFLLFTAYAEFTFASFLLIFLAVYALYLMLTRRQTLLHGWMIGRLLVFSLAFLVVFWPILGSMLNQMRVEGDYSLAAGWGFADVFSADLLGFLIPSTLHPLFGDAAAQAGQSFTYTNFAAIGLAVLGLALAGAILHRKRPDHPTAPASFWGASALLYAVLSLGPVLHINGQWIFNLDGLLVRLPLPFFIILHYIPFIKANRYPSRLQVLVVLCLAVLVAYGVFEIANRIVARTRIRSDRTQTGATHANRRLALPLIGVLVCGIILFEYLAVPLSLSDMRVPAVYASIAQDNGDAPVLQLPISWRNSFQFIPQSFTDLPQDVNTVTMFEQFYQTTHQGSILSGNTSRNPEFKFTYFLQAPVIRSIVDLEEGRTVSAEQVAADRAVAPEVLRFLGLKYIILHPPLVGGPVEDYVRAIFPAERIPAGDGLSAYRVDAPPPADRLSIDMGSDLSNLYRAEGWGEPQAQPLMGDGRLYRWSDRDDARIMLPLAAPGPLSIALGAWPAEKVTAMTPVVNGHRLASIPLAQGQWTEVTFAVPQEMTRAGLNDLVIAVQSLGPLPYQPSTPFAIGTTGVKTGTNIVVSSAGLDAGGDMGFAHVYVNGQDAISGRRGLNVAVIDPATGKVEKTGNFDVSANPAANTAFLDFIKAVPAGQAVAIAAMDDASISFNDQSAAALHMIGAQADLRGRLRNSYAALGAKGAAPGTALEQWAQGRPASVATGAHVYGKGLGAAVSHIDIAIK